MSHFKILGTLALPASLPTPMHAGHYLWDVERVNRFVNVHLHCIVNNLKKISKILMLPPPGKISADAPATVV